MWTCRCTAVRASFVATYPPRIMDLLDLLRVDAPAHKQGIDPRGLCPGHVVLERVSHVQNSASAETSPELNQGGVKGGRVPPPFAELNKPSAQGCVPLGDQAGHVAWEAGGGRERDWQCNGRRRGKMFRAHLRIPPGRTKGDGGKWPGRTSHTVGEDHVQVRVGADHGQPARHADAELLLEHGWDHAGQQHRCGQHAPPVANRHRAVAEQETGLRRRGQADPCAVHVGGVPCLEVVRPGDP
eukprot:scaffold19400_cov104-Isochrysis_galbana.AAC.4